MENFKIGQKVINCGITATVVGYHRVTGDLILEAPEIGRWLADPAKTEAAPEKTLEQRHSEAIKKIGGAAILLAFPKQVQDALKSTTDLETKVKMLELIAENI